MIRIKKIAVLTTLCVTAFGFASAVFSCPSIPMGWYLEGNAGWSNPQNKNYGAGTSTSNTGFGWNANVGFKFMPYLGLEGGYTKYGDTNVNANGTKVAKDVHFSYDLAFKGILPLSDTGAELFAKLGAARIKSHTIITNPTAANNAGVNIPAGTNTVIGFYMGVGGEYAFFPYLLGNVQWARAKGNNKTGNLDLYSIGIAYMFQ